MSTLPPPRALFEAHLAVADLDRSIAFYRDVVGLPPAYEADDHSAAFLWVGKRGRAMLGLWPLGSAPMGIVSHVAFDTALPDVLAAAGRLQERGVTPLSFFGAMTDEPSVIGWMPAAAVYFRDPDGHLLEYLAMLEAPPAPELGIVPWSRWMAQSAEADAYPTPITVERYDGPRSKLRPLFALAEDSASELESYLEAGEVLVAAEGDSIVGHLQLVDAADGGGSEIKNTAVAETHRRRGIGTALVRAAADLTRSRGQSRLVVATAAADTDNLRFYQRSGFRLRAVERDAFTQEAGYAADAKVDGIRLRDRVWLDLDLAARP